MALQAALGEDGSGGGGVLLLDDGVRAAVAIEAGRPGGGTLLAEPLPVHRGGPVGYCDSWQRPQAVIAAGAVLLLPFFDERLLGGRGRRRRGAMEIEVVAAVAVGAIELGVHRPGERLCVEEGRSVAGEAAAIRGRGGTGGEERQRRGEEKEAHAPRNCNRCAPPGSRVQAQDLRTKILRRSSYRGLGCGCAFFSLAEGEAVATRCPRPLAAAAGDRKDRGGGEHTQERPERDQPAREDVGGQGSAEDPGGEESRPAYPP